MAPLQHYAMGERLNMVQRKQLAFGLVAEGNGLAASEDHQTRSTARMNDEENQNRDLFSSKRYLRNQGPAICAAACICPSLSTAWRWSYARRPILQPPLGNT